MIDIFGYVRDNIKYNFYNNTITNGYELASGLSAKLGFTNQIANIIHNSILSVEHTGNAIKDASKITIKVKESIWKN